MTQRRHYRRNRRWAKGIPFIYNNRIYLGKRPHFKKLKRKYKRKYKRGRGFRDGFKFLYSLGKQCHNSMQWGAKRTMRW